MFLFVGEPTVPIRSPLREKNTSNITVDTTNRDRSPLKQQLSTPTTSKTTTTTTTRFSSNSPSKTSLGFSSPSKTSLGFSSPSKTSLGFSSPSKSSLGTPGTRRQREEESFNREVTEKTTLIVGEPKLSPKGTKESYTKTTITETEEKIEKKEVQLYPTSRLKHIFLRGRVSWAFKKNDVWSHFTICC